jgi:hypothetical protein
MDGLAVGHVLAIAFWAGIVAVEVLFEAAGLARKIDVRTAAVLHRWTDRTLELPTLAVVTGTGFALWARAGWDQTLFWKAGAGLGAIAFNLICYGFVEQRCAITSVFEAEKFTWRTIYTVAPGFPLAFAALYMGGARAGWW